MMKRLCGALVLGAVLVSGLCACNSVPANTVFSKDDLAGKKIGVQLGTTGDVVNAAEYKDEHGSTVVQYNKGVDAVQALKQGDVDAVIIDEEPAKVFVERNDDLKILDDRFDPEYYAICLKKGNDDLREKINTAMKAMKADGTLQKIIDNYIGENAGKTPYTSPADTDRSNGKLTMATNAQFPPYEYVTGDAKIVGLDVDMAQALCDRLGYDLEVKDMEFESILGAVDSGVADMGVAGLTDTEDRRKSVDFTESYTTSKQVIIVRKK